MLPSALLRLSHAPLVLVCLAFPLSGALSVEESAPVTSFQLHPHATKQVIWGFGFEIQSDSIGSGNHGLPEQPIAVPHDLTPSERRRLSEEMLKGFRYCRLAGGLYWRGLDPEGKFLRPRWPEQLIEIREMLEVAGVEGLSFEYWSPAPFWKANRGYIGQGREDPVNLLRCFGPDFANDPDYRGDVDRFLADFANAVVTDIKTLKAAGIPTAMWGLQNEPWVSNGTYPSCRYPDSESYVKAYRAVASAIRRHDARILLFSDTEHSFPRKIGPAMHDPEVAGLVDAYAIHAVGAPSEHVREVHEKIRAELPWRPWFQNEYEYLDGGATPERCLNTVQHIMNSFQLGENPTWFWIHALKPFKNAEASGYSLGFWKSLEEPAHKAVDEMRRRWRDGPELTGLPREFEAFEMISATRGEASKPGIRYDFSVNQPVTVYLLVEDTGGYTPGEGWEPARRSVAWAGGRDIVYRRAFPAGRIDIPAHSGKRRDSATAAFGAPHVAFVEPSDAATFKAMIGVNVPIQIRSEFLALEREAAKLKPGHWMFNPYNWNAVGSFVKRMPWDCVAVAVDEASYDPDARIFAFKRPNGKLTVVVSNRTAGERTFDLATGLPGATWRGFRYTPDDAGADTLGVEIGKQSGARIKPTLPRLSWEFWEEQ
ncbi:MAG TPA: hypothetical protein VGD81_12800 [Opitutaceae bacterium]